MPDSTATNGPTAAMPTSGTPTSETPADAARGLYPALGRVASGLYILTIGSSDCAAEATATELPATGMPATGMPPTGMLVSWVQQAGFEPPMVTLSLKAGRAITDRVTAGEPFVLSIVPDGDKSLLKHFGKGFAPGEPAMEGLNTVTTSVGVPAPASAVACLECRSASVAEASDHVVVVAHVTGGQLMSDSAPAVHTRKRGDHY